MSIHTFLAAAKASTISHWITTLLALTLGTLHPAPKHDDPHHRQPVTLAELASAR